MRISLLAVLALVAACGGSPKPTTEPTDKQPDAPVVGPPAVAWKDMSHEQKAKFMDKVVMPKMKPLFQAFNAKDFGEFDCKTCHGKDGEERKFAMPNPGIFPLPATMEGFGALQKEKPEYMKFMAMQVKPEMAKLLGLEEFDPANPKPGTFGCMECHTAEKK